MIALAWPLVTLAIALIFRHDVTRALGRIGRFKYHDLEITFRQELCHAEELARKLPPPTASSPAPKADDSIILELHPGQDQPFFRRFSDVETRVKERRSLLQLAERSPRKAIESAWDQLGEVIGPGRNRRLSSDESRLIGLLQMLKDHAGVIDREPPTSDEARRFVELACPLRSRIEARG